MNASTTPEPTTPVTEGMTLFERFLSREGEGVSAYVDELNERNPFRAVPSADNVG